MIFCVEDRRSNKTDKHKRKIVLKLATLFVRWIKIGSKLCSSNALYFLFSTIFYFIPPLRSTSITIIFYSARALPPHFSLLLSIPPAHFFYGPHFTSLLPFLVNISSPSVTFLPSGSLTPSLFPSQLVLPYHFSPSIFLYVESPSVFPSPTFPFNDLPLHFLSPIPSYVLPFPSISYLPSTSLLGRVWKVSELSSIILTRKAQARWSEVGR